MCVHKCKNIFLIYTHIWIYVRPWWLRGKESICNAKNAGDVGSIPGSGNPVQYYCLGNPMDRGAWQATADGSQTVGHD